MADVFQCHLPGMEIHDFILHTFWLWFRVDPGEFGKKANRSLLLFYQTDVLVVSFWSDPLPVLVGRCIEPICHEWNFAAGIQKAIE